MTDIFKDFAVKALNLTDERLAEIVYSDAEKQTIKDNAIDELLRLDAERVKIHKAASNDALTAMHDKGYKKAQGETLAKFEQSLKEEFGVGESKAQGSELVKEIINKISKDTQLDDNKVKLHPLYIQLEKKLGSEYVAKADHERIVEEYNGYKSKVEKEKVLAVVKSDALRVFLDLKPVLSKDPAKAVRQQSNFLRELETYEYEVQADGSHIIKVAGNRYDNKHGHPVAFKDFVKEVADQFFDFEVQPERGSPEHAEGKDKNILTPQSEEEYRIAIATESDPAKRVAIKAAWDVKNKK